MKRLDAISPDELRRMFRYDAERGELTRISVPGTRVDLVGQVVPGTLSEGYLRVRVGKYNYGLHRIIWAVVHGRWPENEIDRIDGDKTNNILTNLTNLREATRRENVFNSVAKRKNKLGMRGVYAKKLASGTIYRAGITIDGKKIHIGRFKTVAEAFAAYEAAAKNLHGEFAYVHRA